MQIQVVYKDGRTDRVEPKFLDILLYLDEIIEFRRSDHWVDVGTDPIRSPQQKSFRGRDRRQHRQPLHHSIKHDSAVSILSGGD